MPQNPQIAQARNIYFMAVDVQITIYAQNVPRGTLCKFRGIPTIDAPLSSTVYTPGRDKF